MSQNENETKPDKSVKKEIIAAIALIAAALITGLCGPAVLKLFDRTSTPIPTTTPSVAPTEASVTQERSSGTLIQNVYYAIFGAEFPEGAWKEGETYNYTLQMQECGPDNFKGEPISFSVSEYWESPFYLLKDGLYDNYDKNYAHVAQASSFQQSFAMVLLSKDTREEALRVLESCQASIIINNGPPRPLEPYDRGATLAGIHSPFNIDTTSFMEILP